MKEGEHHVMGEWVGNQENVLILEVGWALEQLSREWPRPWDCQISRSVWTTLSGAVWDCWGVLGDPKELNQ